MIYIGKKKHRYYKDILMMVDEGMHEEIYAELSRVVEKGSKILDLGCGEGALSQRLVDHGYEVYSVDKEPKYFKCNGSKFIQIDFDKPEEIKRLIEEHAEYFDAVLGIEVIEHVENQWEYLRGLKRMCKPGGYLFVSTPNIQSWLRRLQFLLSGRFHQFSESDLSYGHISPLSVWELNVILRALHLKKIKTIGIGKLPALYLTSIKTSLASFLCLFLRPFMKENLNGWCILTICRK